MHLITENCILMLVYLSHREIAAFHLQKLKSTNLINFKFNYFKWVNSAFG